MRAWGRDVLPINKMDWLSWLSQLGYTQLWVVHGTVSLRGKKDGEGELQLWFRAMLNDCRILYASRIAGHDEMVCELLMFSSFTSEIALTKSAKSKRYQQRSRPFISSNTENKHSRLPITRTFKGNRKKVRVIGSSSYRNPEENSREQGKTQFLLHSEHFNHI